MDIKDTINKYEIQRMVADLYLTDNPVELEALTDIIHTSLQDAGKVTERRIRQIIENEITVWTENKGGFYHV